MRARLVLTMGFVTVGCGSARANLVGAGLAYHPDFPREIPMVIEGSIEGGGPKGEGSLAWSTGPYYRWSRGFATDSTGVRFAGGGWVARLHLFRVFTGPIPGLPNVSCTVSERYRDTVFRCHRDGPDGPPLRRGVILTGGVQATAALGNVIVASRHALIVDGGTSQFYRIDSEGVGAAFGALGFLRVQYPLAAYLELHAGVENIGGYWILVARTMLGIAYDAPI